MKKQTIPSCMFFSGGNDHLSKVWWSSRRPHGRCGLKGVNIDQTCGGCHTIKKQSLILHVCNFITPNVMKYRYFVAVYYKYLSSPTSGDHIEKLNSINMFMYPLKFEISSSQARQRHFFATSLLSTSNF